jgi:hypothetical protein
LQASAKHYESVPDVLMAEALGARDGLLLARAGGYGKVIREVDNLSLVNLLSIDGIRSPIAGIWHEITDVGRNFTSISISFVHRRVMKLHTVVQSLLRRLPRSVCGVTPSCEDYGDCFERLYSCR